MKTHANGRYVVRLRNRLIVFRYAEILLNFAAAMSWGMPMKRWTLLVSRIPAGRVSRKSSHSQDDIEPGEEWSAGF